MAIGGFPELPFAVTEVATALDAGHVLGNVYAGQNGKLYALWQIDPILINDTFANNELCYLKASLTVTNDVSDAIDGGDDPVCAGVARGSLAESTGSTTVRYGLFQVFGRGTVKTNGDDDISAGDMLIIDTANDGGCNSLDPDAETTDPGRWGRGSVGIALADDSDSANTVDVAISVGVFF